MQILRGHNYNAGIIDDTQPTLTFECVGKGKNSASSLLDDQYAKGHFQRIGSNVSSYVGMVSQTLRNTIPKAVVHCQVREAKRSLLDRFYAQLGKKEV